MRILQLCTSKGFGGLELYVLKVVKFLNDNKYNYNVITGTDSFLFKKLSENKIKSYEFSSVFHPLPLFAALRLSWYINQNEIDVLHIHWGDDLFLAVLAKFFSPRKLKLIYTRQMSLTRNKHDVYHRFLYRHVDAYIVITEILYRDAVRYLPLDIARIHVLYYGVSAPGENSFNCENYISNTGLNKDCFKLAIFGRIEKGKGQHLVVEAIRNLKNQDTNIQLAIIGHIMDEKYFSQLQSEIKKYHLEDNVFYLGFHNSPTSIMPCFNAVVLATKCETFGLVLPEAMRAGVTVLGSNCGGVPEIIEHEKTGLLFETENVDDLTNQLLKLINDTDFCDKLAKAGKIDADERFSEEKHFEKLLEIYETA